MHVFVAFVDAFIDVLIYSYTSFRNNYRYLLVWFMCFCIYLYTPVIYTKKKYIYVHLLVDVPAQLVVLRVCFARFLASF